MGRRAESLKLSCDFYMKMKEKHLKSCLFDQEIQLVNNEKLIWSDPEIIKKNILTNKKPEY